MQFIFFIIVIFYCTVTYSQESAQKTVTLSPQVSALSDTALLKKAKSLRNKDQKASIQLANKALGISEQNENYSVSGQAHTLLGKIFHQSKDNEKSLHHFLQASLLYKNINDKRNQIINSVHYINVLLAEKKHEQAKEHIDGVLTVAIEYNDMSLIALILVSKGDNYYKTKNYNSAITQYSQALEYQLNNNEAAKKRLGETYKKIALSYKRLKNRKEAAYFYKKTLDVYVALNNKKSIAQTLNALAEAERYLGNLTVALEYSLRSLEIHKEIDDPVGRNKTLLGAGILYRQIGRYEKSLIHIHQAHLYYKEKNNLDGIAETSNQLGAIYTRLEQFDEARTFYQISIDLPPKYIKQKTLAATLRQMAVIDLNSGNFESALIMAKRAHKIYTENDNTLKAVITARIIADIFRAQKHDATAINYYKKSLQLATELGDDIYKIKAQIPLASILIGTDTNEAVKLLKESLALSIEVNDKTLMLDAYRKLGQAEKSRNNFEKSLYYAEEEKELTKTIQDEKDEKQLMLVKANVYSHQIEIELESLRKKVKFDQLELSKKNNEIEIEKQTRIITELELVKNKYASIALALLLAVCVLVAVFIYRRFNASKKRNQELDYLVARDPLTNCYNRRVLFDIMKIKFEKSESLDEYCIIMGDIDHFKKVNDTHGHVVGDGVICGVANILQSCISQNDILSRFGGEEFCIILHNVSQSSAMRIAENMRNKIEQRTFDDISVTCSFGVSSIIFNAKTPLELINQADLALYQSKSNGRNKVTLWDESIT